MFGPILSALLMGMVPVWGIDDMQQVLPLEVSVAPPDAVLAGPAPALTIPGRVSASGILVLDLDSGQTIYQRGSSVARPMASLTKLMTALLIVENHSLNEWVKVPDDIVKVQGSLAHLPPGEEFTVGDLLSALLLPSGNDAAVTLARYHSGSVAAFVKDMNARAQELGLKDTEYVNPIGFDAPEQHSSPRDVGWLTLFVWRYPEIATRMGMRSATLHSRSGTLITVEHTHELLGNDKYPDVIAGKTGTTEGARQCLLSIVEKGARRYVVVLLDSSDRYTDMRRILDALTS